MISNVPMRAVTSTPRRRLVPKYAIVLSYEGTGTHCTPPTPTYPSFESQILQNPRPSQFTTEWTK